MRCRKILTTLVVIALVASTMIVLNKLTDFKLVEDASAIPYTDTPGVEMWEGNATNQNGGILNMTEAEMANIKVGKSVTMKFNGTLIDEDSYIWYPEYRSVEDSGTGEYEVYVNWSRFSTTPLAAADNVPQTTINFAEDGYPYAGMWLIVGGNAGSSKLWKMNMSTRKVNIPVASSTEVDIKGWFWVNSSSDYTVHVSKSSVYYGKEDETLTIEVKDSNGLVSEDLFIDIWNVYDVLDNGEGHMRLAYHKWLPASAGGTWTINNDDTDGDLINMSDVIENLGAGTYQVAAYRDIKPGTDGLNEAQQIYGASGGYTKTGEYGYNKTFGKTDSTNWSGRFIHGGAVTNIRGWDANPVSNTQWNSTGSLQAGTTYNWDACGPFNPPEYWATYVNFTVAAGKPSVTFNNETQLFWNESYSPDENQMNVTIKNYKGEGMDTSQLTVRLYNKSNNPARSTSSEIPSYLYSYDTTSNGYLAIYPAYNDSGNNRWGWNGSYGTWAAKGKVYVVISRNVLGNESEEWNTTFTFNLISATNTFKWIHDGSTGSDSIIDGELGAIPSITNVPVDIKFKFISSDYWYWGDGNGGESTLQAAENITISGNSIFTGKLNKYPNFDPNWFASSTGTWTVPIIPTMSIGGGEIKITARAWNATIEGKLSIGGSNYLSNGSVITVTPNVFDIDEVDQTLDISVQTSAGTDMPGASVTLYYIDEDAWDAGAGPMDGANQHVDRIKWWPTTANTMGFNRTQQTINQSSGRSGLSEKHAPRNLTLYASSNNVYGYALIRMDPNSNMEVAIGRGTFMAGYPYNDFSYSVTLVDSNDTPSTLAADKSNFHIKIVDQDGDDKTSSLFSDAGYGSSDFSTEYSRAASYFTDIYAIDAGTYTFYAYNKTHDSTGNNATLVVERVDVSCDKAPFIWKYDDNISATFSIRYNGAPVNGSLLIDNMSDVGDYNMTWKNTSFDGTSDQGGNTSIEVDSTDIINGDVTVHDITADFLETGEAIQNITFWFKPITEDDIEGAWARADGICGVSVPAVAPDPMYVSLGTTTTVTCTVTGRGTTLADIFVGLDGRGISVSDTNGTTGSDGTIQFSITPSSSGDIDIHVGAEGRVVDTKITVTNWVLDVSVDVSQVNEGSDFTVTVIRAGTTTAVEGATVSISGIGSTTTDSEGEATFTAPDVSSDTPYTIKVTKAGYKEDPDTITIKVIDVPKIYMTAPTSGTVGESFTVKAGADDGNNNGIVVTISKTDGTVVKSLPTVNGQVSFTIEDAGKYKISATKTGYTSATEVTIEIKAAPTPGFELLTLIIAIGVALILLRRRRK